MTSPWEEIFCEDEERKRIFEDTVLEYDRLKQFYPSQGYSVIDIPKASVNDACKIYTFIYLEPKETDTLSASNFIMSKS